MRPKVKFAVIHRHRKEYPISVMCKFFGVSRSGYYAFVRSLEQPERDEDVAKQIEECQNKTDKTYGYRRVWKWLKDRNIEKNPKNCTQNHEKVWFAVRDPPSPEMGESRSADAQV